MRSSRMPAGEREKRGETESKQGGNTMKEGARARGGEGGGERERDAVRRDGLFQVSLVYTQAFQLQPVAVGGMYVLL